MGYFIDTLRALGATMANVFRPPITVQFPEVVRPRTDRLRVSFALPDDEHGEIACIGCLACERICPSQVIKMKATGKKDSPVTGKKRQYVETFTLDLTACIQCELCVQVCNSDAIFMVKEAEVPGFSREDLVLDIEKLRANARNRTASWGRGTVLQEAQEGAKPKKPVAATATKKPIADAASAPSVEPSPAAGPAAAAPRSESQATPEAEPARTVAVAAVTTAAKETA